MLPFTRDQFFEVFAAYNAATWPAAVLAYPLALAAVMLAWRGGPAAGRVVAAILALMWAWVGIVYHGLFFVAINPVAPVFAALFVGQAALLGWHAWKGRGLGCGPRSRRRAFAGGAMIIYALVVYPIIGLAAGERFPSMPLFGVAPCPLLIFTLGLMLWSNSSSRWLWVMLVLWAVVGGSAAVLLSVPQDWALSISALISLLFVWVERPAQRRTMT